MLKMYVGLALGSASFSPVILERCSGVNGSVTCTSSPIITSTSLSDLGTTSSNRFLLSMISRKVRIPCVVSATGLTSFKYRCTVSSPSGPLNPNSLSAFLSSTEIWFSLILPASSIICCFLKAGYALLTASLNLSPSNPSNC